MESLFLLNDKEKLVLSSPKLINSLQFFYVTKRNQSEILTTTWRKKIIIRGAKKNEKTREF